MKSLLFETQRKNGVRYALTDEGVELPVVDVTHPAFALTITEAEMQSRMQEFLTTQPPLASVPALLRKLLLRWFLRGSTLAAGIRQSRGTYMSGMNTYLLKLGPEMIGAAYSAPVDPTIASSLPGLCARLRLQDIAQLMADFLLPALRSIPRRPLHLLNIAGGPAMDSLNALILLSKQPDVLAEREVTIDVLDLDDAGPAFGRSALAALAEEGAPLHGTRVDFQHIRYNWKDASDLGSVLQELHRQEALGVCSSEGGLFEYGSDEEVVSNLARLRASSEVAAVVGSVTRADETTRRLHEMGSAAVKPRGMDVFGALVHKAGWTVARVVERPFSDQFLLT